MSASGGSIGYDYASSSCQPQLALNGAGQGLLNGAPGLPVCTVEMSGTVTLVGCTTGVSCTVRVVQAVTGTTTLPGDLSANGLARIPSNGGPAIYETPICAARLSGFSTTPTPVVSSRSVSCSGTVTFPTPYPDQPVPNQCVDINVDAGASVQEPPSGLVQVPQPIPPQPVQFTASTGQDQGQTYFLEQIPRNSGNVVLVTSCE